VNWSTPDELPSLMSSAPWKPITNASAITAVPAVAITALRMSQRRAPNTARPASSATKLDCENVSTKPPHMAARPSALSTVARARLLHNINAVRLIIAKTKNLP
jgi:hypothetical protein